MNAASYLATSYLATSYLATSYLATSYLATSYLATSYLATSYQATSYELPSNIACNRGTPLDCHIPYDEPHNSDPWQLVITKHNWIMLVLLAWCWQSFNSISIYDFALFVRRNYIFSLLPCA